MRSDGVVTLDVFTRRGGTVTLRPLAPAEALKTWIFDDGDLRVVDSLGRDVAYFARGAWLGTVVRERATPEDAPEEAADSALDELKVGDRVRIVRNPRGFLTVGVGDVVTVVGIDREADRPVRVRGDRQTATVGFAREHVELVSPKTTSAEEFAVGDRVYVQPGATYRIHGGRDFAPSDVSGPGKVEEIHRDGDLYVRSSFSTSASYVSPQYVTKEPIA